MPPSSPALGPWAPATISPVVTCSPVGLSAPHPSHSCQFLHTPPRPMRKRRSPTLPTASTCALPDGAVSSSSSSEGGDFAASGRTGTDSGPDSDNPATAPVPLFILSSKTSSLRRRRSTGPPLRLSSVVPSLTATPVQLCATAPRVPAIGSFSCSPINDTSPTSPTTTDTLPMIAVTPGPAVFPLVESPSSGALVSIHKRRRRSVDVAAVVSHDQPTPGCQPAAASQHQKQVNPLVTATPISGTGGTMRDNPFGACFSGRRTFPSLMLNAPQWSQPLSGTHQFSDQAMASPTQQWPPMMMTAKLQRLSAVNARCGNTATTSDNHPSDPARRWLGSFPRREFAVASSMSSTSASPVECKAVVCPTPPTELTPAASDPRTSSSPSSGSAKSPVVESYQSCLTRSRDRPTSLIDLASSDVAALGHRQQPPVLCRRTAAIGSTLNSTKAVQPTSATHRCDYPLTQVFSDSPGSSSTPQSCRSISLACDLFRQQAIEREQQQRPTTASIVSTPPQLNPAPLQATRVHQTSVATGASHGRPGSAFFQGPLRKEQANRPLHLSAKRTSAGRGSGCHTTAHSATVKDLSSSIEELTVIRTPPYRPDIHRCWPKIAFKDRARQQEHMTATQMSSQTTGCQIVADCPDQQASARRESVDLDGVIPSPVRPRAQRHVQTIAPPRQNREVEESVSESDIETPPGIHSHRRTHLADEKQRGHDQADRSSFLQDSRAVYRRAAVQLAIAGTPADEGSPAAEGVHTPKRGESARCYRTCTCSPSAAVFEGVFEDVCGDGNHGKFPPLSGNSSTTLTTGDGSSFGGISSTHAISCRSGDHTHSTLNNHTAAGGFVSPPESGSGRTTGFQRIDSEVASSSSSHVLRHLRSCPMSECVGADLGTGIAEREKIDNTPPAPRRRSSRRDWVLRMMTLPDDNAPGPTAKRLTCQVAETSLAGDGSIRSPLGRTAISDTFERLLDQLEVDDEEVNMPVRSEWMNWDSDGGSDVPRVLSSEKVLVPPLLLAMRWCSPYVVRALILRGANIHTVNHHGQNALSVLCSQPKFSYETAEASRPFWVPALYNIDAYRLRVAGFPKQIVDPTAAWDVDAEDCVHQAIDSVAEYRRKEMEIMAKLLICNGISFREPDTFGRTAYDYAVCFKHAEIQRRFDQAERNPQIQEYIRRKHSALTAGRGSSTGSVDFNQSPLSSLGGPSPSDRDAASSMDGMTSAFITQPGGSVQIGVRTPKPDFSKLGSLDEGEEDETMGVGAESVSPCSGGLMTAQTNVPTGYYWDSATATRTRGKFRGSKIQPTTPMPEHYLHGVRSGSGSAGGGTGVTGFGTGKPGYEPHFNSHSTTVKKGHVEFAEQFVGDGTGASRPVH